MATIRREIRIDADPGRVWDLIGEPAAIATWFPGIVAARLDDVEGRTVRRVELATGLSLDEEVVTNDAITRRFQYRITGGLFRSHLGTVDVIDLGDGTSLAVYGTDAEPDVMALVIGGATGVALENIKALAEHSTGTESD